MPQRRFYPALQQGAYFNYGGQGVLHQSVIEQITANYQQIESLGCYAAAANDWIEVEKQKTRSLLAQLLCVAPATLALTRNTTEGCNIALWSYAWQPGDHLLLSDAEHPGIVAIARQLVARFGISMTFFSAGNQGGIDSLVACLQENTRMVMISHISWNKGHVFPLESIGRICHARNIWLAVDAAQSVGMMPLNLAALPIDFYAFTGHKWLCGPLGVGGLYIHPDRLRDAHATFVGWRGLKAGSTAAQFEIASDAYPLWGALRVALDLANHWGDCGARFVQIIEKSQFLWQELQRIPQVSCLNAQLPESGLVPFTLQGRSAEALSQALEAEHRIFVRAIPQPACLRASVSYLTTEAEISRLVEVLKTL